MRSFTRTIAGVGALVASMSLAAWAHDMGFVDADGDGIHDRAGRAHEMRGRIEGPFGVNLKNTTLTADQQTQVDKLKADYQAAVTPLQTTLQTKETELRALVTATTPDKAAITAKIAEIDGVRSQIQAAGATYSSSVLGTLTAEQRGTLDAQRLGLKGITLTADQLTQIDKLTSSHQAASATLQTTLQTKETELRTLMTATTPDKTAINAKIDELNAARSELQKEMTSYHLAVRGLLTAEQQAALPAQGAGVGFRPGAGHGPGGRGHGRR